MVHRHRKNQSGNGTIWYVLVIIILVVLGACAFYAIAQV